jgi:alkanesulfonate monooxygenase SsuD/methylene tetrahydromethanopterin reductase-like flavin-dependent oxidoreductase (luciferase family)
MKFGLDVPTTEDYAAPGALAHLAAAAEAAGWDGFFIWDVLTGVDPWLALAEIARQTSRIKIGFMILPLARHRPWLVARRLADLDHLSGGRVICTVGLGHQDRDFAAYGEDPDPVVRAAKLDEGLAILDGLWTQETFSFSGTHYTLTDVSLTVRPIQTPRIPVWVAGGWPRRGPFRRAARWDGVSFKSVYHAERRWLTLDEFRAGLAYVQANRTDQTPFDMIMSGDTSGDRAAAIAKVQAFAEAGATWWVEEGLGWTLDEFQPHVRQGPPRGQ